MRVNGPLAHGLSHEAQEHLRTWLLTPEGQIYYRWLQEEIEDAKLRQLKAPNWEDTLRCRGQVMMAERIFSFVEGLVKNAVQG